MFALFKTFRWQLMLKKNVRGHRFPETFVQYQQYQYQCLSAASCGATIGKRTNRTHRTGEKFLRTSVTSSNFKGNDLSYVRQMASSSSVDPDDDNPDMDEVAIDHTVDADTDGDMSHLRVKLYSLEENQDIGNLLEKLYDSASIQQVFEIVEEHEKEAGEINVKIASQALVTIWDLQKFLFIISANFDPEKDYLNKPTFIEKICQHPVFIEKIVKPVIDHCEELEDEPLVASLLCLKRLNYDVRGSECGNFVDECLRREDSLSLPSVSRLCVCLRDESIYGNFIIAKFSPLLWKYVESMSDDIEIRLVAISLRNTLRIISSAMIDKFRSRIDELKADLPNWETVTLCKILLLLMACRNVGTNSKHVFDLLGEELATRVPTMALMDLLSLQKFLELGYLQPYELVEALVQRMMRIVQEGVSSSLNPRLDLLSSISPYLKSVGQRRQMSVMLRGYLDNHPFEFAAGIMLTMLRWIRTKDVSLLDSYWRKAADIVEQAEENNILDRRTLKIGRDYISFCSGMGFAYRSRHFENSVKKYYYKLIDNYYAGIQPCFIHPGDFSRALGFLIGVASFHDPIFDDIELVKILSDFAPQFRPGDLSVVARGLDAVIINLFNPKRPSPKYYDKIIQICSILEEQCFRTLANPQHNTNFPEMHIVHRVSLVTRRVKGESPMLDMTMRKLLECSVGDARVVKDLAQILLSGNNYYPQANEMMTHYIWDNRAKGISPEVVEKYVTALFASGWEDNRINEVMEHCSAHLTKNWDKLSFLPLLQSTLGLCYYRQLSTELIRDIFSVEFLDQVDDELAATHHANNYPLKLRQAMMELNRAVCIDMPDVNLPWFHGKFCEQVLSLNSSQETYLHGEVRKVLSHIVGDSAAVQYNMCSPYYYKLDFLIEFDEKDRPIKKVRRQPSGFFQKFRQSPADQLNVRRKVAVLLLTPSCFTKGGARALKGHSKLRRRHLEMLGYDVIEIDPVYWNSMFMSEHVVRQNFLETKLYANANVG